VSREALQADRDAAVAAGDPAAELHAREALAVFLVAAGDTGEAEREIVAIEALAARIGDRLPEGQAAYLLGTLAARTAGREDEAIGHLERAVGIALGIGAPRLGGRALARLATLAVARADYDAALAALDDAAEAFDVADDTPRRLAVLRLRTLVLTLASRPEDAFASLTAALAEAEGAGVADAIRALRLDRRQLTAADPTESLDALVDEARDAAGAEAVGPLLERAAAASREGRLDAALADVRAARDRAREAIDPIGYFLAAILEAEVAERSWDRPEALAGLLEAEALLGQLLGDEARATVDGYVQALRARWGEFTFRSALRELEHRIDPGA
jgi:tetratricopeptide (TPR) repeat protein